MKELSVINFIEVPSGMEEEAIRIRNTYVEYFKTKKGFVKSIFYKSIINDEFHKYVNIVVWDSKESFDAVVNQGFENVEGINSEGYKVLGKGFPEPIRVSPSQYEVLES